MAVSTIPSFSRVEIRLSSARDILRATAGLRALATELDFIAGQNHADDAAVILAHHKIKAASQKLRTGE